MTIDTSIIGGRVASAILGLTMALLSESSHAMSLNEALSLALGNSPSLDAAERDLAAIEERVPQASAGYLPQMDFTGSAGVSNEFTNTQEESFSANSNASLILTQPIYRGGGTVAAIDRADFEVLAQQQTLKSTEQTVLLDSASIFMDVWRDRQVRDLISETYKLVETELGSVSRQKDLGAATSTDVAQTEARLNQIEADKIQSDATLITSEAQFERLMGLKPGELKEPTLDGTLPSNVEEAVAMALAQNPRLKAAMYQRHAAERAIDAVSAEYWPSVDLQGALQYFSDDIQEGGGEIDDDVAIARVDLRVTVPLYRGGGASSRVREADQIARAVERQEEDTRRQVSIEARGAWTRMSAERERIERLEKAVAAADRAVQGTEREYQLGKRTTLDLLDARQDLLDLQTALVGVRRDLQVAMFDLLVASGQFTAGSLDLDTNQ